MLNRLNMGGPNDQTFGQAGTPHGGDHLGHPGEAVGRSAEWRNGLLGRQGIAARQGNWAVRARFLPGARPAFCVGNPRQID